MQEKIVSLRKKERELEKEIKDLNLQVHANRLALARATNEKLNNLKKEDEELSTFMKEILGQGRQFINRISNEKEKEEKINNKNEDNNMNNNTNKS